MDKLLVILATRWVSSGHRMTATTAASTPRRIRLTVLAPTARLRWCTLPLMPLDALADLELSSLAYLVIAVLLDGR